LEVAGGRLQGQGPDREKKECEQPAHSEVLIKKQNLSVCQRLRSEFPITFNDHLWCRLVKLSNAIAIAHQKCPYLKRGHGRQLELSVPMRTDHVFCGRRPPNLTSFRNIIYITLPRRNYIGLCLALPPFRSKPLQRGRVINCNCALRTMTIQQREHSSLHIFS
jgi:hypothetical protein